jgi:hypothetical protein
MLTFTLAAFGAALSPAVSDGDRWVAIQRTPTTVEVRDDLKGLKWTLALECTPTSVSRSAQLVADCEGTGTGSERYAVVDLRSRVRADLVVEQAATGSTRVVGAGTRWVALHSTGTHEDLVSYLDRTTGAPRGLAARREVADLDRPGLTRTLCAPVRRPASPYAGEGLSGAFDDVTTFDGYDGRAAVTSTGFVWRCGDARPRTIAGATSLTVGAGWLTWATTKAVVAERLSDRRRFSFRGPSGPVAHTRKALYVTTAGEVRRGRLVDLPRPSR